MFDELKQHSRTGGYGGFLPGIKQIANVAALPGIVGVSITIIVSVVYGGGVSDTRKDKWGSL